MKSPINRRDFLKLSGLLPLTVAAPRLAKALSSPGSTSPDQRNVILVVFDALSACNMPSYGYSRMTTPNLTRLAKRAIVYHNHFAGANFTSPGTASLLTGTLPWTHRAIHHDGRVTEQFVPRSIFRVFQDYHRLAYSHNGWAFGLLQQFWRDIDELIPTRRLFIRSLDGPIEDLFVHDDDTSSESWARDMGKGDQSGTYSLFASHLYQSLDAGSVANLDSLFPRGLPAWFDYHFLLETAIDWTGRLMTSSPQPFLAYFHFLPPHEPYCAAIEFCNSFSGDRYKPPEKPPDEFRKIPYPEMARLRRYYDEYVLYADQELGRFFEGLEAAGLLQNSWVILTSDHGEMFERGWHGHDNPTLYQPLVRIPLLIFEPRREAGLDIRTHTSAVDILPTLAHVTGHAVPDWSEGTVLPPFAAGAPDLNRSLYALQARNNAQYAPLTQASTMLVQGNYKLIYCFGYADLGVNELIKLYDIQADPEELSDLYPSHGPLAADLLVQLKSKLKEVNQPYL